MKDIRGYSGLGSMLGLLGVGLVSVGCSGGGAETRRPDGNRDPGGVVAELRSAEPRVEPDIAEAKRASEGEQQFAINFLHALDADANLTFSPHSLSTAFAMVTDAAQGRTLDEIEQVLAFGPADEDFHRSQDALALGLAGRNREAIHDDHLNVDAQILTASNDIWIRDDAPPQQSYLDTLAQFYGVGVHQADFSAHPEEARVAINAKVSHDTHELIGELIPEKLIDAATLAVLTNAIYFKAPWAAALGASQPGDFYKLDGSTTSANMMRTGGKLRYYAGPDYASVGLPYYGGELEMVLIVPNPGAYATVRAGLSSEMLSQIAAAGVEPVDLTLPKLDLKSVVHAKDTLKALGMSTPFEDGVADFPKLTSPSFPSVFIGHVLHQATVSIDEKGTEASAATAVIFSGASSAIETPPAPPPQVVVADRPFLFVIRDIPTGSVLFIGQVVDP